MSQRFVTPEPLAVAGDVVGTPLAAPWRRFAAFAIDYLILIVPSIAVALGVAALAVRIADPGALRAMAVVIGLAEAGPEGRQVALQRAVLFLDRHHALTTSEDLRRALAAGPSPELDEVVARTNFMVTFALSDHQSGAAQSPDTAQVNLERLVPTALRAVSLYGLAALYFALFTRGRRGATPGKRLLGIRVVRLDGHPLSLREGVERFIGYLHIPGSLFLDLVDLWHDPNRRLPHDRVVHTAVVRVARPAKPAGARVEPDATPEADPEST